MGVLQDQFERVIKTQFDIETIKKLMLRRAAKQKGIELSDDQIAALSTLFDEESNPDREKIPVSEGDNNVVFSADDLKTALADIEADVSQAVEKSILVTTEEVPTGILGTLYKDAPRMIREHHGITRGFERRLYSRWREGLDRLKMLIVIAQESGNSYLRDSEKWLRKARRRKSKAKIELFTAIVGLHVRACRLASEVLCLLKSGFADGANARWRTLHEVATIIMFLTQHKGDTAVRYLRHAAIERLKAARQYQVHCSRLGYEPFSDKEMSDLQREFDQAVSKFGADFAKDYGWAAKAVGKKHPTFTDIEANTSLAHWRPHFKMACHSIHAGSQGLFFSLGSPTGQMHSGASNVGLSDPAHSTAISLSLASTALLTFEPSLDGLVTCGVMRLLTNDIGDAFLKADELLEQEISQEQSGAQSVG
jgi:hypothetical protein